MCLSQIRITFNKCRRSLRDTSITRMPWQNAMGHWIDGGLRHRTSPFVPCHIPHATSHHTSSRTTWYQPTIPPCNDHQAVPSLTGHHKIRHTRAEKCVLGCIARIRQFRQRTLAVCIRKVTLSRHCPTTDKAYVVFAITLTLPGKSSRERRSCEQ